MGSRFLLVVAVVAAAASLAAGQARAGSYPFDAASPVASINQIGLPVLAAPLFLPGEVDLSTLGVSSTELAGAGVSGAASSSAGDGPNMFIVDDDHAQCPNAQFTTIQSAVDAAPPGSQIKVCPGDYTEQVQITTNDLTLFSQVPLQAVIHAPTVMVQSPHSIVSVIGATGVSIRQFTITGPYTAGTGCVDDRHSGVRLVGGSATIYGNHITNIRDVIASNFGCQDGIAVQIGRRFEGQTGTAVLSHNLIDRYQKGGVVVDNAGSYAWVTQNEITGEGLTTATAQNGVQVGRGAAADVDHNLISDNQFVRVGSFDTAAGVLLFETSAHVSTDHNDVFRNGVGIDVDENAVGLTIAHNNVRNSINDGIGAFLDSANNLIAFNKAFDNSPYDCYDETTGPYAAGTANDWRQDMGGTENRAGLCKKATP